MESVLNLEMQISIMQIYDIINIRYGKYQIRGVQIAGMIFQTCSGIQAVKEGGYTITMKENLYWGMAFCNPRMFKTVGKIQLYRKQKEAGEGTEEAFLKGKKKEHVSYYMTEHGQIFKFDKENFKAYELDLHKMTWFRNQDFVSIYLDDYLKYTEMPDFEDDYDFRVGDE